MPYNYTGYFIEDPITFAKYVANKAGKHASAVRIQKSMYLLYKIYTSTLGHLEEHFDSDVPSDFDNVTLPDKLFPAHFEAWEYGPVDRTVYDYMKEHKETFESDVINAKPFKKPTEVQQDVLDYLEFRLKEITDIHDFGLVHITRDHDDFKQAIKNGKMTPIPEQAIINDALSYNTV